jgi:hypothetical protein
MGRLPQRWAEGWARLDAQGRRHTSALVLIGALYLAHYLVYTLISPFYIEDAGISFAYAQNLVEGEGLVAYPGGERVEGYSNALWTFLVAAFYALGVPVWGSAKLMGAALGLATLPLAARLVDEARPGPRTELRLLAPLLLAASPQFVLWNASGLENSLFVFLLTAGLVRLLGELRAEGAAPWSGLLFFALTMTRPEGVAYAGIAGLALLMDAVVTRRLRPVLGYSLALGLPLVAYNLWRTAYFAWPFPNTYYAKLGKGTTFKPWTFDGGGWKYVGRYLLDHGIGPLFPVFALGALMGRRKALALTVSLSVYLGVVVLWDGKAGFDLLQGEPLNIDPLPEPVRALGKFWPKLRAWSIAGALGLLGLLLLGGPGWRARGALWAMLCFGGFFALYSGGDWMKGHRWFSLIIVPIMVSLTVGLGEVYARWLQPLEARRHGPALRRGLLWLALGAMFANEARHIGAFAVGPETSVRDIRRRVDYMAWVQRRLDVDHITLLDVDMGAHMLYSGWEIVDIAGLVDVPMARHSDFERRFLHQYLMVERLPDFAHVHGGWATSSKIPQLKGWKDQFIELPGYPIGERSLHIGNHIRKGLFVFRGDEGPPVDAAPVTFAGGLQLLRFAVPAPVVAPGGALFVETLWQSGLDKTEHSLLLVLRNAAGDQVIQAFAAGYGWYPSAQWGLAEKVESKLRLPLPADLPPGDYDLAIVVLDSKGVRAVEGAPAEGAAPLYLAGEWRAPLRLTVTTPVEAMAAAEVGLTEARALATGGDCAGAWARWKAATRHVLDRDDWIEAQTPLVRAEVAGCHIQRALAETDRAAQVEALRAARRLDHRHPALMPAAGPLADALQAEGEAALAAGDWGLAYDRLRDALRLDPSRSWARRAAEEARDNHLRIVPPGKRKDEMPWFLAEAGARGDQGGPTVEEATAPLPAPEAPGNEAEAPAEAEGPGGGG